MESTNKMELTYTNVNGYLIPNLTYKSGEQMEQLGKYGFLRRDYLKNHRNSTYQVMLLQDTIGEHLLEVDFCPALCIPKMAVLQAFWGISHFVWYCKAVSDLS